MKEMTFTDQKNIEYIVLNVFYNEEYNKVYALYAPKKNPKTFHIAYVNNSHGKYQFLDIKDPEEFEKIKILFYNLTECTIEEMKKNI